MKRLITAAAFLLTVMFFNSFAAVSCDVIGTVQYITIQPNLEYGVPASLIGYVFVKLNVSQNQYFYIAPTDVTYEIELATLITAKSKGSQVMVGMGNLCGGSSTITWGGNQYSPIYYLTAM